MLVASLFAIGNVSGEKRRYVKEEEKNTGKAAQDCNLTGQNYSLILAGLLVRCCSADWTGRMINLM